MEVYTLDKLLRKANFERRNWLLAIGSAIIFGAWIFVLRYPTSDVTSFSFTKGITVSDQFNFLMCCCLICIQIKIFLTLLVNLVRKQKIKEGVVFVEKKKVWGKECWEFSDDYNRLARIPASYELDDVLKTKVISSDQN